MKIFEFFLFATMGNGLNIVPKIYQGYQQPDEAVSYSKREMIPSSLFPNEILDQKRVGNSFVIPEADYENEPFTYDKRDIHDLFTPEGLHQYFDHGSTTFGMDKIHKRGFNLYRTAYGGVGKTGPLPFHIPLFNDVANQFKSNSDF